MISSPELRGEIRKQMDIRRWDSEDLGRATGYAGSTVRKYMCDRPRPLRTHLSEPSAGHSRSIPSCTYYRTRRRFRP